MADNAVIYVQLLRSYKISDVITWHATIMPMYFILIFTARAYARAVLGVVILSVCPSVCPSVTRVDCDKSKWCTADIIIPHERAITLLL